MFKLPALVIATLLIAQQCLAQSANDTILYLLHGFEGKEIEVRALPGNPNIFLSPLVPKGAGILIGVKPPSKSTPSMLLEYEQKDCITTMKLSMKSGPSASDIVPVSKITLDWSKVSSVSLEGDPRAPVHPVKVVGLQVSDCEASMEGQCQAADPGSLKTLFMSAAVQDRLDKALTYFKSNYCKGNAF